LREQKLKLNHVAILGPCSPSRVSELMGQDDPKSPNLHNDGSPVNAQVAEMSKWVNKISVLTYSANIENITVYQIQNVTFYLFPLRKNKMWVLDCYRNERKLISKKLAQIKPDLVHAHWTYEYALIALQFDSRSIVSVHDNPLVVLQHTRDILRLMKFLMTVKVRIIGRDSHFVFVSKSIQESWSRSFRFRGKYTITPNILAIGVNRRKTKKIPLEFTTIGNASKLKNVESILQVWVDILIEFPGAHLNLIGADLHDHSKLYEKWSQSVGRSVTWHGYIRQTSVEKILDDTTFYVHFSLEESQGLSVAEAMSRGCVCILNKSVPALYETTGGTAFFVNPSAKDELIRIVRILIADNQYRETSAIEAITSVKNNFDKNLSLLPILKLYEEKWMTSD